MDDNLKESSSQGRWICQDCRYRNFKRRKVAKDHVDQTGHKVSQKGTCKSLMRQQICVIDTVPYHATVLMEGGEAVQKWPHDSIVAGMIG